MVCHIPLESFQQGLQLCFRPHINKRLAKKVVGPKTAGAQSLEILRLSLGSPRTKCHLDVALVKRHKIYYKGEGGGFPQVRPVVSVVSPSLPVARPSTKSGQTMY